MTATLVKRVLTGIALIFFSACNEGYYSSLDPLSFNDPWQSEPKFPTNKTCSSKMPFVMMAAEASSAMEQPAFFFQSEPTMWDLTQLALKSAAQQMFSQTNLGMFIFPLASYKKTYKITECIKIKPSDKICIEVTKTMKVGSCTVGLMEEPFGTVQGQLISKTNLITPDGDSPIAEAVETAGIYMNAVNSFGLEKHLILITSGDESCGGDPVAEISKLRAMGMFVTVVSFENASNSALLNAMAEAGGRPLEGEIKYRIMKTGNDLSMFIKEIAVQTNSEECNNADDDCDGLVDEDLVRECAVGCGGGVQFCKYGKWGGCVDPVSIGGNTIPEIPPEVCDSVDNDCNGQTDEAFPVGEACSKTSGSCISVGEFECSADGSGVVCNASTPAPSPEICDNKDNDCDGKADEELSLPCENQCGSGTKTCSAGQWSSCAISKPNPELCNGAD
ncbi:MAG: VWA domain-containing protein, partial [Deltaproteobacteria bacterium]|nr:VWA domain-containing protein [Deltaproteobacteria bacterium]